MNSFLFSWNPKKYPWPDLTKAVKTSRRFGRYTDAWSCISYRQVQVGDRAFLARVGVAPRGIMGSGYIASEPYLAPHWNNKEKSVYRVNVDFDVLMDPEHEEILALDALKFKSKVKQVWTPQSSGILVRKEVVGELEAVWDKFLMRTIWRPNQKD
jgi:5-methylcytosine-specific restriction protein A